jgi:hypothetical protein
MNVKSQSPKDSDQLMLSFGYCILDIGCYKVITISGVVEIRQDFSENSGPFSDPSKLMC